MFIPRRLDKHLSQTSPLPLRELREALKRGEVDVEVAGERQVELEGNVLVFEGDIVRLHGAPLHERFPTVAYLLNKPTQVTCTARDPKGKRDLSSWLARLPRGVFPVGRLDRETTGALLFTNDGDLATALLQPSHETTKRYWLWLNECIEDDDPRLEQFRQGVTLPHGQLKAKNVAIHKRTPDYTELHVELEEGKNRQIRRMCRSLDLRLLHLHRDSIASFCVSELNLGGLRQLSVEEVELLWANTGGRAKVEGRQIEALWVHAARARAQQRPLFRLESWLLAHSQEQVPQPGSSVTRAPAKS
jgi:23S rRNA pseudouridine2605 synthase